MDSINNERPAFEIKDVYFYSAKINMFYHSSLFDSYISADAWPDDAIPVDDAIYKEYAADPAPVEKMRIAGADGMPTWGDVPPPTSEQNTVRNSNYLNQLIQTAITEITILQSALSCDRAREGDQDKFVDWQNHLCDLRDMTPEQLQMSPAPFPDTPTPVT